MNRMHRRSPAITFAALFATVALAGCSDEQNSSSTAPAPAGPPPRRAALVGDLAVFYDLQITQTTGTGTGNSPVKATAIHFYEEYIVIDTEGGGRIIPIRQIKTFSWSRN